MRPLQLLHAIAVTTLLACLVLQVFLAGLGVFDDPASFVTHREFGYLLGIGALLNLAVAAVARAGRRALALAALILGLIVLQSVFIAFRVSAPEVAALHPVNGFLIVLVATIAAQGAWAAARAPRPTGREAATA